MKRILAAEEARNTLQDEILNTNKVGILMDDPPSGPYFDDGVTNLLRVACWMRIRQPRVLRKTICVTAAVFETA